MTHDRMKMKAEQVQLLYGVLGVFDGARALQRIDGRPSLSNHTRIIVAHLGDVFIRTGGVPVTVSISKATSIASTPASSNSAMTSVSVLAVQARFQYLASAST